MSPENSHSERSTLKYHKMQLCLETGPLKRKLKLEAVTRDCLCTQREDHMRSCGETTIYKSRRETFDLELDHGLAASKSMRKHICSFGHLVGRVLLWQLQQVNDKRKHRTRHFSQEATCCSVASQTGKSYHSATRVLLIK